MIILAIMGIGLFAAVAVFIGKRTFFLFDGFTVLWFLFFLVLVITVSLSLLTFKT